MRYLEFAGKNGFGEPTKERVFVAHITRVTLDRQRLIIRLVDCPCDSVDVEGKDAIRLWDELACHE